MPSGLEIVNDSGTHPAVIQLTENSTPVFGVIEVVDSDPTTTPTASIENQTVTVTDASGNDITSELPAGQIAALEQAFSIATTITPGGVVTGVVVGTYNPQGLNFLTAGETALVASTVDITDQDGNSVTATFTDVLEVAGALFTTGNDNVNFGSLTPEQVAAINAAPTQLYNALGGSDSIVLPTEQSNGTYVLSPAVSATWDPTQTFIVGALTDTASDTDTITGSGDYRIAIEGPATVNITLTNVDNTNGNLSSITAGSGHDTISISGTGNSTVTSGSGGTLTVNGTFVGSGTIGNESTLELNGAASGGPINFDPTGTGETLQIDGTTMPTNVITRFGPSDTIDLRNVPFDSLGGATLFVAGNNSPGKVNNLLDIVENGVSYSQQLAPNPALQTEPFGFSFGLSKDAAGGTNISLNSGPVYANQPQPTPTNPTYSTSAYPYNGVVYLQAYVGPSLPQSATGFIIGPHTILTAAHVLFNSVGQEATNVQISGYGISTNVVVGQNGEIQAALTGPQAAAFAKNPSDEALVQNDYAIINVAQTLPSYDAFGIGTNYPGGTVNVTGYPGTFGVYAPGTQSNDIGNVITGNAPYAVLSYTTAYAPGGNSGGPVWISNGSTVEAVGIVSTTLDAVQLTPPDLQQIQSWENSFIVGTPGQPLKSGNGSVFLDGSLLQNQSITAGNGMDAVIAGSNDTISLGNGSDNVAAGSGCTIKLGNGSDTVTAGANSTVTLGNGPDTVTTGANSKVILGNGNNTVSPGSNSTVTLGNGNNTVFGSANDTIAVGNGQDQLVAAPGDVWTVGKGQDVFTFNAGFGKNTITDFNTSHDVLQFNPSLFASYAAMMSAGDISQSGANTVITDHAGDTVTLTGVTASSLTAHNFHFA